MKNTNRENNILFYSAFVLITVFKFSFAGFSYTPYLDDYVQYIYYPYFRMPFSDILFGGPGTAYTRPFAAILDIYFWSKFFPAPQLALILLSVLFAASGIIFFIVLKKLNFPANPLFLIIFALLPSASEGTYWISAATRIVPGIFFAALSLYYMVGGKRLLFFIFSLLSHGFYEQICILSFCCALLIFLSAPKKYYKEFIIAVSTAFIIGAYYLIFGKMGDNSERLGIDARFYLNFGNNLASVFELFFAKQIPLYTKGFLRGIKLISDTKAFIWLLALLLISIFLILLFPKEKSPFFSKKKLLAGFILFFAPVIPFLVIREPWLNFRNIVPSILGFAIIIDTIFSALFKYKTKYVALFLSIYLCICNSSEVWDYNKTAAADLKIINEIASTYKGENTLYYEIKTDKYLEQNSPYHDHIMSITGSDWGLTGTVRAVLKNKDIVVKASH